ncbi:MAG: hypothetical protein K1060chlam2_00314 [Chlamydiae bacterium]|nr:hypothetical protein [Chlamydiota bacterium]
MKRIITQEVTIHSDPNSVYAALTDPKKFSGFTGGAEAEIDTKVGGKVSLFDGKITGTTLECIPDKRLIQAWRAGNWDEGIISLVKFELSGEDSKTLVRFEHVGFPVDEKEHLEAGWHKMYWEPLKAFLEKS